MELSGEDAPALSNPSGPGDPGERPQQPLLSLCPYAAAAEPSWFWHHSPVPRGFGGTADSVCSSRGVHLLGLHLLLLANRLQAYGEMSQAFPYMGTPESLTRAWLDMQEILGFNGPVTSRNECIHSQKHTEMVFNCSTPVRSVSAASAPEVAKQHTDPSLCHRCWTNSAQPHGWIPCHSQTGRYATFLSFSPSLCFYN